MRNLLFEVSAIDPANPGSPVVLRASTAFAEASGVNLDGKEWAPVLIGGPEFEYSYWNDGQPQALDTAYGSVTFLLDPATGSNVWPKYSFEGANATVWVGTLGDPFTSYRKLWSGKLGPLVRDSDQIAHIPLLGAEADLVRDLLSATYAGTGGAEGGSELQGTWKPFSAGACVNVAPVLVDAAYWVFQVNGYSATPVTAVYSNALPIGIVATVSTYAELIALNIPDGKCAVCPPLGMFRLKNDPEGAKITADIGQAATVGGISAALMGMAGLSPSRIDASVTNTGRAYCLYAVDQTSILDVIRDAALAGSSYLIPNSAGVFCFAPIVSAKAPGVLSSKRDALPLVQPDKIVSEPTKLPAYKVRVGHTRVWAVHSTNEISPAIADLAANQTVLDAKAEAAQETADLAVAEAALARAEYASMVADGILDRAEKRRLVERFEGYTAERPGILAEASNQNVTTERSGYDAAYAALKIYLESMVPAYDDTSADTVIDPSAYIANLVGYDLAKSMVLTAIANKAAQTAAWGSVTGPGKPQDNATVGAPSGTPVGNTTADEVVTRIETARQRIDGLVTATADMVAKIGAIPADATVAQQIDRVAAEKSNTALSSASALVEQASTAAASATNAVAQRTSSLEASYTPLEGRVSGVEGGLNGTNDRIGNEVNALNARITGEAVAAANATGAVASRTSSLESNVGNLHSRVSTTEGAISNLNGRTGAFWQTQTVAGNNRAQLSIYADANGGAGVDIVGDVSINGSLFVSESITTGKLAPNSVTIPQTFNFADANIGSPLTQSGGGYYYNYVGYPNGDYEADYNGDYGGQYYYYVGDNQGSYIFGYTPPSYTGGHFIGETDWIYLGSNGRTGGAFVMLYGTVNASQRYDAAQQHVLQMDRDDGQGWVVAKSNVGGVSTNNGDTKSQIPISLSTTVSGVTRVRFRLLVGTYNVRGSTTGGNASAVNNVTLTIMGGLR